MGAFDSIKMGHRCKAWLVQSDVPSSPSTVFSRGTSVQGRQWIINAATGDRRRSVMQGSAVVLDGGPRWVLSTALGFLTGGVCWTIIYAVLFVLAICTIHVNSAHALWRSDGEVAGIIAYTILAAALSVASVPGAWFVSEWKGLASGLVVEVFLCFCVIVSAGIVHGCFGPSLADNPGLSPYADAGRWAAPALIWRAATELREKATQAVKIKLGGLWCSHPMGADSTSLSLESLWNDWSSDVSECARRVGGYSMLGFSASDLAILSSSSPSPAAQEEILKLRSDLSEDTSTTEPWIRQSAAFLAGYDSRLTHLGPESGRAIISLPETERVTRFLISGSHPEVDFYKSKIKSSDEKAKYVVSTAQDDERWFYAGALLADSDQREGSAASVGCYGSRLAVSVAVLVEGTDPLARLTCYAESKGPTSSVQLLSSAISSSTSALVSKLAHSAGVTTVRGTNLGVRGLAYATGVPKSLAYSPDELAAASHLDETIVISDDTFSAGSAETVLDSLWGGSGNIEKKVDVSDMISEAALASGSGVSALLGWMCHLGFTLAILTVYLSGSNGALVVLLLVGIPATDKRVSVHMDDHYYMIYVSYVLNYARCLSRRVSLSPRGQATIDKARHLRDIVFVFVNILPVLACFIISGRGWWLAFTPCILANLPGLLNTFLYGWASAFKYDWWSWHVPNRWFSGRGYLEIVELRKRVGRNVLSLNATSRVMAVKQVLPLEVSLSSQIPVRFMVVGGRSWPMG